MRPAEHLPARPDFNRRREIHPHQRPARRYGVTQAILSGTHRRQLQSQRQRPIRQWQYLPRALRYPGPDGVRRPECEVLSVGKSRRRVWFVRLGVAAGLSLFAAALAAAETQHLTILHDNDLHGHLRAFCYTEIGRGPAEMCNIGGAARRATLITALKRRARAPILLVDDGDIATRGPLATQYEGLDEIAVMNAMGYDLAELGNNEFKLKDGLDKTDAAGAQAAMKRLIAASLPVALRQCDRSGRSPARGRQTFYRAKTGSPPGGVSRPDHPQVCSIPTNQGVALPRPYRGGADLDSQGEGASRCCDCAYASGCGSGPRFRSADAWCRRHHRRRLPHILIYTGSGNEFGRSLGAHRSGWGIRRRSG
jgi:hypothetical protein